MNIFDIKKIHLLKRKIKLHKIDAREKGKFSLFHTKFSEDYFARNSNYKQLTSYYDIVSEWNKKCNLSYDTGMILDKLTEEKTVMIHRTRLGLDTSSEDFLYNDMLYSIMNDGLKNYGHANSSGVSNNSLPPLTLTMTPLKGLAGYINLLSSYKANDIIIIAAFPKNLVNDAGEILQKYEDIYDGIKCEPRVKKEYIVGAILKKNNGLDEFYTRDEIIAIMDQIKTKNVK